MNEIPSMARVAVAAITMITKGIEIDPNLTLDDLAAFRHVANELLYTISKREMNAGRQASD
jgi:hypothetical protein